MSKTLADRLLRWVREAPAVDLAALAKAARSGPAELATFRAESSHPKVLLACADIAAAVAAGEGPYIAGILEGALAHQHSVSGESIEVVWTGPKSAVTTSRLTSAVIADLLAEATREILLVSYASYPPAPVVEALMAAASRGVEIVLLAERPSDNPGFTGIEIAMPHLPCRRLHWPGFDREPGAALHAKVLVIDAVTALVGSANFTGHAMERNLECGVLLRGGRLPEQIRHHLMSAVGITHAM
jgi:cardiolipin synthase